jgi:hypothetical protein
MSVTATFCDLLYSVLYFLVSKKQSLQELDTFSIQLETAFRQAAAKAK